MVGIVVLALMVSFVIARYEFKFNKLLYSLFAAGMMFPITVAITPLYLLLRNLHLINSHLGIILPQIAFGLPQAIIILVPFLKSIPKELEEAAELEDRWRPDRCCQGLVAATINVPWKGTWLFGPIPFNLFLSSFPRHPFFSMRRKP